MNVPFSVLETGFALRFAGRYLVLKLFCPFEMPIIMSMGLIVGFDI